MEDLIDFSEREDEFLDKELKQKALSFAIITSITGFVFSSWLFLGQKLGPAAVVLDRRAAEGRVVTRAEQNETSHSYQSGHFSPPRIAKETDSTRRTLKPIFDGVDKLEKVTGKTKKPVKKPKEVEVAQTTLGSRSDYLKSSVKTAPKTTEKKTQSRRDSLDRLLFPIADDRPERGSLGSVEAKVRRNLILLGNTRGEYVTGVGIDSSGRAMISSEVAQAPGMLSRIWYQGTLRSGRVVGNDPSLGVSYIQIDGASFFDIPLAPSPPSQDERVLSFITRGRESIPVNCAVGLTFGKAGFFLRGGLGQESLGAPLFNDRGELLGCYVQSLPEVPGSGIHLASDSAALYRLVRGYNGSGSVNGLVSDAVDRLSDYLVDVESKEDAIRGRVLPGIALSDFHLGMPSSKTERWLSAPEKRRVGPGLELWTSPAPPVSLYFAGGRLLAAGTSHTAYATLDGMAPGSRVDHGRMASEIGEVEFVGNTAVANGLDVLMQGDEVSQLVVTPELTR